MRYLYVVMCGLSSLLACPALAQQLAGEPTAAIDSVWHDASADNRRRVSSQSDSTGACTEVLRWSESAALVRVFYPSGHLKEYVPYGDLATGSQHGVVTTWFDTGQLQTHQPYLNGQRNGTLRVYYATGALKRETQYVNGNELPGSCFDPTGQPLAYFPYEQLPLYPGGETQLSKEINKALHLPQRLPALSLVEPLLVDVEFQVSEDGSIKAPRVALSSHVPALDQAVLAAVAKLTRAFTPARRDGRIVTCSYHLPVQFKATSSYQAR
jgi:protein TonB